jgi:hypothetical protein
MDGGRHSDDARMRWDARGGLAESRMTQHATAATNDSNRIIRPQQLAARIGLSLATRLLL